MNSNPCEVTVHTQREKKKEKKKRKTWKVKRSFNLNPNALLTSSEVGGVYNLQGVTCSSEL